jgi:hypothetical protein
MGWRENGESLILPWRMARAQNLNDPKHALFRCVREYAKTGEMTIITDYLRSPNAVGGALEREMISQVLEFRAGNRQKDGGRPTNWVEAYCAAKALGFYHVWRFINWRNGDSAHSHQGEMKDIAASYVLEVWLEHLPVTNDEELFVLWERVRSRMERPGRLRRWPKDAVAAISRVARPLLDQIFGHNPPK